jgi:stage II sporulation protein D
MRLASFTLVRALAVSAVVFAFAVVAASPAQPSAEQATSTAGEALFLVTGRGYGHGVGMGQYGAFGQANAGRTHEQILTHYYAGTTIGRSPKRQVRVLLAEGRPAAVVSSPTPFSIVDAKETEYKLPAGAQTIRPGLKLVPADGVNGAEKPGKPQRAAFPLTVLPGKGVLSLDAAPYRGKLEAALQGGFLRIVNVVPLELYLQGVVANEMPHTWPSEALQAQAVAARSYALANLVKGKPFDLYSDQRSQVYDGVAGEQPRTTAAVEATARQVLLHGGRVATTYYYSSSGGKTASAVDVFGANVPYLVSRPDPWDRVSPWHSWGPILFGARTLQSHFGVDERVIDATGVATPSGRLRTLTLHTVGGPVNVPVGLIRSSLGLRSTWITIGVLRLDRPRGPVAAGESIRLEGIARGVQAPVLASSKNGTSWTKVGKLQVDARGVASFVAKPLRTMRYRIQVDGAASAAVVVRVLPR